MVDSFLNTGQGSFDKMYDSERNTYKMVAGCILFILSPLKSPSNF